MAEKKTGFEKFLKDKTPLATSPIRIAKPSTGAARVAPEENQAEETREAEAKEAAPVQETVAQPVAVKRPQGRPRLSKEEKESTERICFEMPRDLKFKLDELKHKTYKKSYREIIIEALTDILKKYEIE